ncbi:glycerophosphodiester phosphodiesterase [Sediminispirochaeta bajacaliforniensis]|uniref:glycerophosphodiester phosphodiesterase n=1 Tax=Sediminispirochaeta bajacaliforniensis TaxID=148 RepID=UPI0003726197|nr:glycerophosphodiester phosphodiesterase [Sediminispirochaeta bajacaliforniensis]
MDGPMITGHTGNDGTKDNSLEAAQKSIALGADAFEVDVRRDKNSVLILSHNEWEQNGYGSHPQLSEIFELLRHHPEIRINCDLKEDNLPLEVISLASRFGIGSDRLILTGLITLPYLEKHPEITKMSTVYLNAENILESVYFQLVRSEALQPSHQSFYARPWKYLLERIPGITPHIGLISEMCLRHKVRGVNVPYQYLKDENIDDLKKKGIPLSVWTVNDENELVRFLSCRVENVTTRKVVMAKAIRKHLLGF